MGSVVISGQRPPDGLAGGPVVPDGGGHGQQPLGDAGVQARGGAAAVAFEVELALEGVVDRFDPLPDPADRAVPGCLVAAVRADQAEPVLAGDQVLEVPAREALVPDQGQARPQRAGAGGVREQVRGDLAFPILGSARHHATGIPSGVVSRYSFRPQYQRECAAQYP